MVEGDRRPMTAEHHDAPLDASPLEQEAYDWVVRFISGEADAADLAALQEWAARSTAHADAFDRASKVWKALDRARQKSLADSGVNLPVAAAGRMPRPAMARRAFLGGALAASAAVAAVALAQRPPFGLWPSWSELAADYRTNTGERRRFTLSDGVSVEMNTQTSIALRSTGENADRIELINGEAMIQAPAKSAPLTVLAAGGRIVADGARFNVRREIESVCVTCLEGGIEVECSARSVPLSAGRQVAYSSRGIGVPVAVDPEVATAWKDGIIIFDGTPIADVIAEINRYRHGKVILTNAALGRERFNARFRLENIDRVVGQIELVFGVRARSLPGGIVLLG
jgi:transmembrane sensor